tara:strand:- start:194 stop:367 length:174 start_codon:yes stop_codon:yes gene_type:complete
LEENKCCKDVNVVTQQEQFNDEVIKQFLNITEVLKKQVKLVQYVAEYVGMTLPEEEE